MIQKAFYPFWWEAFVEIAGDNPEFVEEII
jgi:hypothetical protein